YAHLDGNNDGKIDDTVDSDGDGLVNSFDTNDAAFGSPRDLQGKFDLFFDGRNDYVEDTAVIDGWSEATIMGWIKIDPSASGDQIIFGQNNFYVQLNSDKTVSTFANGYSNSVTTTLNTAQWTHVAASYSNTNNSLRLYINGKIIDNVSAFGSLPADTSSFTIGRQPDTDSKYFDGYIDEVRIFFKALHIKELKKLVCQEIEDNSGTVRGLVIPTDVEGVTWANLRRYYRMDAYKDNVLDDLTTPTIDEGSGARIYNIKLIDDQSAPLPYITKQSGRLDVAVNDASKGISGGEALLNEGAIVKIAHNDVYIDSELKHTGLIIDAQDAGSNPIEFSVKNDSELNISFYLELDGKLDLEGESQLVQGKGSILDADSSGYIEKDQQGTANSYNYNYWSSSVGPIGVTGARGTASTNNDFTLSNALLDGSSADDGVYPKTINFQSSYAAADSGSSDPITLSTYWLWKYHGASDDYYAWQKIYPSTPLLPGEGYTMKGSSGSVPITSEQNYVFRGKPYNGDFTLPLTPGNDRLIGNPYPSAMDAEEFIKDNLGTTDGGNNTNGNVFNGALYFWDHFGSVDSHHLEDYVGGYATRNLIGGAPAIANDTRINATGGTGTKIPGRYIPVNQGFFVLTSLDEDLTGLTEVNGGDIVFKNSQRIFKTEATSSSVFMRNAVTDKKEDTKSPSTSARVNGNDAENESDARPLIRLNFDSPKGYHRQIVAGVDKNATNSFDLGYDALLPDLGSEDLFWTINNTQFVIQGVDNFDSDQELPLGLIVSDSGIAKIAVNKLENIDANVRLYIKDKSNDETFEITNKSFEIELDPGEYYDRFSLVFQPRLKTLDEVTLEQGINIFMNESNTLLQVNRLVDTKIESVRLFNSLGQSLNAWDSNLENRNLSLEVNNMSTGLYIVQLETIDGDIIKKMLVE
ncbi:MAG: T9SS type A sorting domain-containing protein, partial [Flavobacteriaceae bacterium]|nr:T9SS type A sorting domain-containing protein [Flavobacteriaceae bacterium]